MDKEQILHLAKLARIELTEEEIATFPDQFKNILEFVDQIKDIDVSNVDARDFTLTNIMREDVGPHESGENRDEILAEMPARVGDLLKVKKILNN